MPGGSLAEAAAGIGAMVMLTIAWGTLCKEADLNPCLTIALNGCHAFLEYSRASLHA